MRPGLLAPRRYIKICEHFTSGLNSNGSQFVELLLEPLLELKADPVANVRLGVARLLSQRIVGAFGEAADADARVDQALAALRMDPDSDVSYFASAPKGTLPMALDQQLV